MAEARAPVKPSARHKAFSIKNRTRVTWIRWRVDSLKNFFTYVAQQKLLNAKQEVTLARAVQLERAVKKCMDVNKTDKAWDEAMLVWSGVASVLAVQACFCVVLSVSVALVFAQALWAVYVRLHLCIYMSTKA
jgi:hypothetical protein